MDMATSTRLIEMGLALPEVAAPLASYIPAQRSGNMVYTSGQLPLVDGELIATGKVGADVDQETAIECARVCALNALAAIVSVVGDIDRVTQVVKVVGFVASAPDFTGQPAIINGTSDLLGEIFGDAGVHARSAVGVAALPKGAPVEVEMIVEVSD
jgi:enamine deaminase RidA (YjgF/YER057c/UK114 family)